MKTYTPMICALALATLTAATPLLSDVTCPAHDALQIEDNKTGKLFTIECDTSHHGGILHVGGPENHISAKTLPYCVAGCAITDGCILVEWDPVSTDCWLKNTYGLPMRKEGTIAASLEVVPRGAEASVSVASSSVAAVVAANASGSGQGQGSDIWVTATAWSTVTMSRMFAMTSSGSSVLTGLPSFRGTSPLDVNATAATSDSALEPVPPSVQQTTPASSAITSTSASSVPLVPSSSSSRAPPSSSSSLDTSSAPIGGASTNGACGPLYGGQTCFQWASGKCCSPYGICGSGPGFCMAGCQPKYGECSPASNVDPIISTSAPLLPSSSSTASIPITPSFVVTPSSPLAASTPRTSSVMGPFSSSPTSQPSTFVSVILTPPPSPPTSLTISDPTTSPAAVPAPSPPPIPSKTIGKRGLLYNDARFMKNFGGEGSKVTWASNWNSDRYMNDKGQRVDLEQYNQALEYVPQLWNVTSEAAFRSHMSLSKRSTVAEANVGVTDILSFNEPNQCGAGGTCMTHATDALVKSYMKMLQPHGKTSKLGSPSVTNGLDGIPWLQGFMQECSTCQIDFVQAHWYGGGTKDLKEYIEKFHDAFPDKPIWLTEFGLDNEKASVEEQLAFLKPAMEYLDGLDYVERYAFFMAKPLGQSRALVNEDASLTEVGKLYNSG